MYCEHFVWCVSCTVVILTCFVIYGYVCEFSNVWVCISVGFVKCGCAYVWVL